MKRPWSLADLRVAAERLGVAAGDEDLERVLAFLDVLTPAFDELELLVPRETVPAGLFLPADDA